MIITYYGLTCFKVALGDRVLAFNPASKESKFKTPRFGADVALSCLNHEDYNGLTAHIKNDGTTLEIYGPGEYESGGVYIKGIGVEEFYEGKKMINTIYSVLLDDVNICHLGALNFSDINPEVKEYIGSVDILFVPIMGGELLDSSKAERVISFFEPKIVIPMYSRYKDGGSKQLSEFIKEVGDEHTKPMDKLTIKKKEIESKDGELIVLSPSAS